MVTAGGELRFLIERKRYTLINAFGSKNVNRYIQRPIVTLVWRFADMSLDLQRVQTSFQVISLAAISDI